nr:PREDICTED: uncharacterized protein C11orf87 homolog [Lepisosteus oculatus]
MSARISPELALPIPPCSVNGTLNQNNDTCIVQVGRLFQTFSSTAVLVVLVAVIVGIIFVSLATSHVHKSKMKKRKIQKAQEEYERDNCSPHTAKGGQTDRQCVMVRSGHRDQTPRSSGGVQRCERNAIPRSVPPIAENRSRADTRLPEQGDDQLLETVVLS